MMRLIHHGKIKGMGTELRKIEKEIVVVVEEEKKNREDKSEKRLRHPQE